MKKFFAIFFDYMKKSDTLLLTLCVISTICGIILISSASRSSGNTSHVSIQIIALIIGIILYFLFSLIDVELIADKWKTLLIFSILLISSLFLFGEAGESGNRAWLRFAGGGIQPAEIVKIPFIILLSKQILYLKDKRGINHAFSVFQMLALFGTMFVLIIFSSSDLGSALVYFFIFFVILFVGGLKFYWFLIGGGFLAIATPIFWINFLTEKQKARILAPYDSSVDPTGLGVTWQANQSKIALASGQFTGSGLYHGTQTQSGAIPQQHTDFIFSVAGEEFGMIGCSIVILLLMLIIIRCIYVGLKSNNSLGLLVCFGISAMLIFQTFENIGMCLGLTPVIGLTLPFFSYGGSSIITLFAAMGIVSGIKMRPKPGRFR